MKSKMCIEFESWHGCEVSDEMDIHTQVAWDTWKFAWKSGLEEEREACAEIADTRAMRCEKKTVIAEYADEVNELRSLAWQFSVMAAEIRKRGKED